MKVKTGKEEQGRNEREMSNDIFLDDHAGGRIKNLPILSRMPFH